MQNVIFTAFLLFSIFRSLYSQSNKVVFEESTLNNGLKIIILEDHTKPTIFYQLTIDVDPVKENETTGYISMTGDLLKSGTKSKSENEISEKVEFIGAILHTYKNGISGYANSQNKNELLEIISDILLNPSFPEEEIEKLKKQQISELISSNTDPEIIANRVGQKLRNQNHPYGEIITEKSIENITREHLLHYYNTYYKPNVSNLIIVGDISPEEALRDAEKYFGKWMKANVPKHEYQFPNKNIGTRVALIHKDKAEQSYISITYQINLKIGEPDEIPLVLANNLLNSRLISSRGFSGFNKNNCYLNNAYSKLTADPIVGYFSANAQVKTEDTEKAINQLIIEINRMKTELVNNDTLNVFKTARIENFTHSLKDPQGLAQYALNTLKYKLPEDYYNTYTEKVKAVTNEQIMSVSKKHIDTDRAIIVVVGDKNKLIDSLKKFSPNAKVEVLDTYGNTLIENDKKTIPEGVTPEYVLEKYINAIGGKEKLEKIQDISIVSTTKMNGMDISQKIYKKAPNKYAQIMLMNENVMMQQIFNGERGIMKGFQGELEIVGDDLENLKIDAALNIELKYSVLGVVVTLEAIESVNDKDAFKLKIVSPTGKTVLDYFEINSGLRVQSKQTILSPQGEFVQIQNYDDYREIEGIKFPFLIKASGVQNLELKVDSVIINSNLSDDLF